MVQRKLRWYESKAWVVLLVIDLLALVIGVSAMAEPGSISEKVLVSTFAGGMGIFGLAIILAAYRRGERWAWFVMWYYPIFLIIHVITLGTVIPDLILAALFALALVLSVRKFFSKPVGDHSGAALGA